MGMARHLFAFAVIGALLVAISGAAPAFAQKSGGVRTPRAPLASPTAERPAHPDAHLAIGQPADGEILSELPMAEIASTEPGLPMPV
jgi:hypothetical protein